MMLDFHLLFDSFQLPFSAKTDPSWSKCLQRSKSVLAENDSEEEIRFDHERSVFADYHQEYG